ncbi:MAG: VapE family protein [Owenweeksia sp.]|nr:VapE family protein [Owenweeksia sp.]
MGWGRPYDKLASTITVEEFTEQEVDVAALWRTLLRKFIISAVATAVSNKPGQLCLVLTGAEGKGKSTWLNNLCPRSLQANFLFTGGIVPKITEKTTVDVLAEKFILHLDDQLDSYTWREYETLKSIITSTVLTSGRIYFATT